LFDFFAGNRRRFARQQLHLSRPIDELKRFLADRSVETPLFKNGRSWYLHE
jgi:hypothetical protein